jgi:hypothetical protein
MWFMLISASSELLQLCLLLLENKADEYQLVLKAKLPITVFGLRGEPWTAQMARHIHYPSGSLDPRQQLLFPRLGARPGTLKGLPAFDPSAQQLDPEALSHARRAIAV